MSERRQPNSASLRSPADRPSAEGESGGDVLGRLRAEIDTVDRAVLERLNERARLVEEIGRIKRGRGAPVYEAARERDLVERLIDANSGSFPNAALPHVFREIISATRSLEAPVRVAYLGPEGTFCHLASRGQFGAQASMTE